MLQIISNGNNIIFGRILMKLKSMVLYYFNRSCDQNFFCTLLPLLRQQLNNQLFFSAPKTKTMKIFWKWRNISSLDVFFFLLQSQYMCVVQRDRVVAPWQSKMETKQQIYLFISFIFFFFWFITVEILQVLFCEMTEKCHVTATC